MTVSERRAGIRRKSNGDTRSAILKEAARLFAIKGYEGSSINDVALATGISKPGIYHHFADKDQIYSEIVHMVMRDMLETVGGALDGLEHPVERLKTFMVAHADFFEQRRYDYIAAQLGFRGLRRDRGRDSAVELRDAYEDLLRKILEDARDSGAMHIPDVPAAARLILSSLNWMARWYQPDGLKTVREIVTEYCDMLLNGLLPRSTPDATSADTRAGARKR